MSPTTRADERAAEPVAAPARLRQAEKGACAEYTQAAGCNALPKYAQCHWDTWPQFFIAYGDLFCGSGPPPQLPNEAGGAAAAAGAGP